MCHVVPPEEHTRFLTEKRECIARRQLQICICCVYQINLIFVELIPMWYIIKMYISTDVHSKKKKILVSSNMQKCFSCSVHPQPLQYMTVNPNQNDYIKFKFL
jgi:hypothetical protein